MLRPKIRSSVSTVIHEKTLEFFLTNTRKQVMIKIPNNKIVDLLLSLDGTRTIDEIAEIYNMDDKTKETMVKMLLFLEHKNVIIDDSRPWETDEYSRFRRVLNFLEDYVSNYEKKETAWNNVRNSHVVIVGLGAVGSWIAFQLAQTGVKTFTLIDEDQVDITNLHRQLGFGESDVGLNKIDVIERELKELNSEIKVNKIYKYIDENGIDEYIQGTQLVINCADKPNVDTTSIWIGESCMKLQIPHIIAGGYNLHLSLIGQTIIPFQSACVKCFETELSNINRIDTSNIRKLHIENRKIGSFGPLCSISASIAAMEAIKVLSKVIKPANMNRRGEFNIYSMDISYIKIPKNENCEWCGPKGIYNK
jgi:molybdopterin/thiamine biosynthesis adenylyltransferase